MQQKKALASSYPLLAWQLLEPHLEEMGWAKAAWSNLFGPWSQGAAMFIQDARWSSIHVKKVTAPYTYPREIEFVTELPRTISGKIRRIELRERERARKSGA